MPVAKPIDNLNDTLKEIVFRTRNLDTFKRLAVDTHYDFREVEALAVIHRKCVETMGPMNRLPFRDVFHSGFDFTENIRHLLIDRIFTQFDNRNVLTVNFEQWVEGLTIVLRGDLKQKMRFAYHTYNFLRSDKLKKEQIFPIMRGCLIKLQNDENPDEAVKDLIDLLIRKMDVDRDGAISKDDFMTAVKDRDVLLLESMGPVFPSREASNVFHNTFTDNLGRY